MSYTNIVFFPDFFLVPGSEACTQDFYFYHPQCYSKSGKMASKDNARSWFVSLAVFVTYFLSTGMVKGLGVMLPVLREQFATQTWIIGLIISLVSGFGSLTCKFWYKSYKFVSIMWYTIIICMDLTVYLDGYHG